jgi:hypothetical protein
VTGINLIVDAGYLAGLSWTAYGACTELLTSDIGQRVHRVMNSYERLFCFACLGPAPAVQLCSLSRQGGPGRSLYPRLITIHGVRLSE